jgi:antitoxin component YwqK of YwqJK toxin-antitoxin module
MNRPFRAVLALVCSVASGAALAAEEPAPRHTTLVSAQSNGSPARSPQYVADYVVDTPSENADEGASLLPESVRPDTGSADSEDEEVIRERFPNGSVKIERGVRQDAADNYINHGTWKMWDERGNLVAQGQFVNGQRDGVWIRWYRTPAESGLLSKIPYLHFTGPFASQATFKSDQLDGTWTIFDSKSRKISQWHFVDGKRHGKSTWWYPNGRKMREATFVDGNLDGTLLEWSADATPRLSETFQSGRKLAAKVTHYPGEKKKSQGIYLFAKEVSQTADDWWNCKLLVTTPVGSDERHGAWTSWYASGQKQLQGAYEHDQQAGKFTWWHPNGQQALEGSFVTGKQDGQWTWWYASGQKQIQGAYSNGTPSGRWTWWREDGKVAQSADLSHGEGVVLEAPRPLSPLATPRIGRPIPLPPSPVTR